MKTTKAAVKEFMAFIETRVLLDSPTIYELEKEQKFPPNFYKGEESAGFLRAALLNIRNDAEKNLNVRGAKAKYEQAEKYLEKLRRNTNFRKGCITAFLKKLGRNNK